MTENTTPDSEKNCLNCGTPLTGKYCGQCGQRDLPARQDLGDLFVNFISSFYSFESKFFNTFKYLLFFPGRIVNDYITGKRESYYHPARMYVFLSFIFFLVFSYAVDTNDWISDDKNTNNASGADSLAFSLENQGGAIRVGKSTSEYKSIAHYDSLQLALPEAERSNSFENFIERKMIELRERAKGDDKLVGKMIVDEFFAELPRMIFLLMPIFALLLKLLYVRRDFYYSEHLIFTIFYYDFLYLMTSVAMLVSMVGWLSWLSYIIYVWIFIYLYKAMRKVYKQRRAKTILKFFLFNMLFFFCIVFAIVGLILVAIAKV
jgi:Protein of unknown function (DUF3667)